MAESHQDLILSILQDLGKENFKLFKTFLRDGDFLAPYGFHPIRQNHLEDKDCVDVATRLISHYTKEKALKVTEIILEKIDEKQLAQRLRSSMTPHMDLK